MKERLVLTKRIVKADNHYGINCDKCIFKNDPGAIHTVFRINQNKCQFENKYFYIRDFESEALEDEMNKLLEAETDDNKIRELYVRISKSIDNPSDEYLWRLKMILTKRKIIE